MADGDKMFGDCCRGSPGNLEDGGWETSAIVLTSLFSSVGIKEWEDSSEKYSQYQGGRHVGKQEEDLLGFLIYS